MMEVQRVDKKEKREEEEEAAFTSPDSSVTRTPRRALRGRGETRAKSAAPPASSADTNGTPSAAGSGRVLRDRSTRSVPVWRRRDLGVEQDDDDDDDDGEEEEEEEEAEARRRRKTAYPRRRRNTEAARDNKTQCGESKDAAGTRAGSRRAQSRSRAPSSRGLRGSARVVCKSEPETETTCAEENKTAEMKTSAEKKSEVEVLLGDEDPPFTHDPKERADEPRVRSEDDEGDSSDEDVPFKDDLNDQSYDPKSGRESQKPRRRAAPRPREKKEKAAGGEKDKKETEVKTEGVEMADVKQEVGEGAEPPRKRGRRRKDDKSPRLPKRRKKPPVQYVRCEMEGCGTVLAHPRYLQHHIKYQHLMKKKYVCPHPSCGRLFRLQKQLLRHAKHHTDQRDYICEFCARAFKSSHNLAVHRMIHTGEKPLQCEICGFTCRQKASLNWHMKKHDADASYQFSCAICGKKFEKKDSVVAHKAKSHPEVLIAEALAANAGALVTTATPTTTHVTPVGVGSVMVLDQEQSLHTMQVPVTLALPSTDEAKGVAGGGGASVSHPTSSNQTVHFVSAPVSQQQLTVQAPPQIVHMTLTTLSHPPQQLPLLSVTHQLPTSTSSAPSISLLPQITSVAFTADPAPPPSSSASSPPPPNPPPQAERKEGGALWEGGTGNVGGVWEAGGAGEAQVVTDSPDGTIQHRLM
ncbi:E3 ubiquitin-protein ligase ZFP91 [Ictalurus punctatus]|uniref:E3 ubiquitin-protein ligase ZFP91 n=1 Tax=Ictalurus punctatus TaxID=7998 RepID=A0A2D0QRR0_ICTPU|nr:E3 ubiquitin-protein ligase ZFP91 [Ictalurus punctatus]XP_053535891.1 E3 ubiquitin-protein ligase ZFP91 [Ictalurus punctatus]